MKKSNVINFCISCLTGTLIALPIYSQSENRSKATPIFDHHVHFLSPDLINQWKALGIPFSKKDYFYSDIDSLSSKLGTRHMKLISMAHVFTSPEFGPPTSDAYEAVKKENDYLAVLKKKHPQTINAYYGIDPLHDYAMTEIKRCHRELGLDGIKLHFNASQVYLTEPEHRKNVKAIFIYASEHTIPVLLHLDNSHRRFGALDVRLLADSILSGLNDVQLQIAHFGTSGGFNERTKVVIDTFLELFAQHHPITKQRLYFDISAVGLDKDGDGVARLNDEQFKELAAYVRKLGFDKILFGTDYPLYSASEYLNVLKNKLNMTQDEIMHLLKEK
ncbi:amidohydrolase [bacterium]|nr:amidohydrolase [bacterium]NUN45596.1 amidohydrolase family protein [bacterium]